MTTEIVVSDFPRNHIVEFGGLPVLDAVPSRGSRDLRENAAEVLERRGEPVPAALVPGEGPDAARLRAALDDPGSVAWWLPLVSWEDGGFRYAGDHLRELARRVDGADVVALVLGGTVDHRRVEDDAGRPVAEARPQVFVDPPGNPYIDDDAAVLSGAVEAMTELAGEFPNLRALFVGEIDDAQIHLASGVDVTPLLAALPGLTEFEMCAEGGPEIGIRGHDGLRRLALNGAVHTDALHRLAACRMPALERLELWSSEEFSDAQDPDERAAFDALFHGDAHPRLRHLGLRDFTFVDAMVGQLAGSPLPSRLEGLDLSRGALTDPGARILLDAGAFRGLARLDLRYHYMTDEMAERVRAAFTGAGVEVDVRHGRRRR
ncbi:hypothetical protein [Actinomadura sp. WMMB 499]|uniref:hypothetical protein n=1 Tax=Actinomadura sp. WMMB 499 TaxID=1219491 RepID=UPI0012467D40|nr:hypothetical protein [Actinomadura sp. WMMB 499]QFG23395.1 hypothetical protein F7P10_22040 [Actinomadura sp. WMMB 499]